MLVRKATESDWVQRVECSENNIIAQIFLPPRPVSDKTKNGAAAVGLSCLRHFHVEDTYHGKIVDEWRPSLEAKFDPTSVGGGSPSLFGS